METTIQKNTVNSGDLSRVRFPVFTMKRKAVPVRWAAHKRFQVQIPVRRKLFDDFHQEQYVYRSQWEGEWELEWDDGTVVKGGDDLWVPITPDKVVTRAAIEKLGYM